MPRHNYIMENIDPADAIDMAGLDTFTPGPRTASALAFLHERKLGTLAGRRAQAAARAHADALARGASPEGAKVAAQLATRGVV